MSKFKKIVERLCAIDGKRLDVFEHLLDAFDGPDTDSIQASVAQIVSFYQVGSVTLAPTSGKVTLDVAKEVFGDLSPKFRELITNDAGGETGAEVVDLLSSKYGGTVSQILRPLGRISHRYLSLGQIVVFCGQHYDSLPSEVQTTLFPFSQKDRLSVLSVGKCGRSRHIGVHPFHSTYEHFAGRHVCLVLKGQLRRV